jgi:hypothetical protein
MMNKAANVWQKIFDRHVGALKSNPEMSASELKSHLKSMIEMIGLRWAMFAPPPLKAAEPSFLDLLRDPIYVAPPKVMSKPREGGEECPWWDRKTRYDFFDSHAKAIILRAADKYRLKTQLSGNSSDMMLLKAVAKMAGHKVAWKKMPSVGAEKGFAASVQFVLDPKADLEVADKRNGGLSNLLAQLEKALKLI